jgi:Ca-activated chloride channel family protein
MSFEEPLALLCLFAVPLAILVNVSARRRRQRYPVRFPALATLAAVAEPEPTWRRQLPFALFAVAVAALAVSLARPQKTVQVPVERASVVLVTDVSASMSATDVEPTRLDAARRAALSFLDRVPDPLRVGLVAYSDRAQTLQTPTTDRDAVTAALESLQPVNGTATGAGLRQGLDDLKVGGGATSEGPPPSALVLLSDGRADDPVAADDAAVEAKRRHIAIYTVALGTTGATIVDGRGRPMRAVPDPEALQRIASLSGGKAFEASDSDELDGIYDALGSQLGTKPGKHEITTTFAGLALLLLAGAVGSSLWLGGRLP